MRVVLSSVRAPSLKFVGLCISIIGPSDPDVWPFDLETSVRVASKVENLLSKVEHARPLDSRIIRFVCDGRTDGQTKATLIAPSLRSGA